MSDASRSQRMEELRKRCSADIKFLLGEVDALESKLNAISDACADNMMTAIRAILGESEGTP